MSDRAAQPIPVLDFLERQIHGTLSADVITHVRYPTAISELLRIRIAEVSRALAIVEIDADAQIHGNQQGTVHGGLLCELADAAIGTAHSTVIHKGESFTSIDLRATFLRPVWKSRLRARAWAEHEGNTISHYRCDIEREDGKRVATVLSTVMTFRGQAADGR